MAILTDAGVALTDSGEVLTTRTGLEAGLFARFRFEEASGLVCRNEVRTLVLDEQFTGGGDPWTLGTEPTGWDGYRSPGTLTEASTSVGASSLRVTLDPVADALSYRVGVEKNGTGLLTVGVNHVVQIRFRVLDYAQTPNIGVYDGTWHDYSLAPYLDGNWHILTDFLGAASIDRFILDVQAFQSAGESADVEFDWVRVYAENAGTPSEDMSGLTAPGVSGRGVLMDGTDYISAPWDGGFTYPTSLACAFKLDTLTSVTIRTLLSLTDASASDVYWQLGLTASGTNVYVARRNTTVDAQSPVAALTTNWHTVVIVFHDATSYTVYLDGDLLTDRTGLTSVPASANVDTLLIGLLRLTSPTQYADGITFDEVSAWNRELSAYDVMNWTRGVLSQKPSVFNMGLALGL